MQTLGVALEVAELLVLVAVVAISWRSMSRDDVQLGADMEADCADSAKRAEECLLMVGRTEGAAREEWLARARLYRRFADDSLREAIRWKRGDM